MKIVEGLDWNTSAEALMREALEQAKLGDWRCKPNPRVGAALLTRTGVMVKDFHKKAGENHAEREVLNVCTEKKIDVRGARMAVTLEPCSHEGATPPCVEALIKAGLSEVIVGLRDPAPWVNGKGIEALKNAQIKVTENILPEECEALNHGWLQSHRLGRAYVRLKMATSLDGKWTSADGSTKWITGPSARLMGHQLRGRADLIVTGRGTVEGDDPMFTVRDSSDKLNEYQPAVNVISRSDFSLTGFKLERHPKSAQVAAAPDLKKYLEELYSKKIFEVHLEAGPTLSQSFLNNHLVDELHLFLAPKFLGAGGRSFESSFIEGKLPGLNFRLSSQTLTDDGDLYLVLNPA